MAPLANPRALRWLAVGIVGVLVLAVVCFYVGDGYGRAALNVIPSEGNIMFGSRWAWERLQPEDMPGILAKQRSLRATETRFYVGTFALLAVAGAGAVWSGWQTRREIGRWHWFSFFGLGLLAGIVTLGLYVTRAWLLALPGVVAFDLLALFCAIVDLRRRQYGAPGRIVSWFVCLLAGGLAALFAAGVVFLMLIR